MSIKYKREVELGKKPDLKVHTSGKSRTRQEFVKESNVNRIVDKYLRTGVYDNARGPGMFADVSGLPDYQGCIEFVKRANESFLQLDVNLRKKFKNNPKELIDFLKDPSNKAEAVKMGLVVEKKPPQAADSVVPPETEKTEKN